MKRTLILTLALAVLAGMLPGCQKKAEPAAIVQRDVVQMLEIAQADVLRPAVQETAADAAPVAADDTIPLPLGQALGVPVRYSTDLTSADGKAHLIADAEIQIPDTESMPIARTARANFRLEELNLLIAGLFGDAPLYWNDGLPTKAEVQALYEHYQEHLEVNGNQLTAVQRENVKTAIERYAAVLAVMPDGDLFEPWNGQLSQQTPSSRAVDAHPRPSIDMIPVDVLTLTDVQNRGRWDYARACFDVRGTENGFNPFVDYYNVAEPSAKYDGESWGQQQVSVGSFLCNLNAPIPTADFDKPCGNMALTPAGAIALADKLFSPFPDVTFNSIGYADDHSDDTVVEDVGVIDIPATVEAYVLTYTQQVLDVGEIYIEGAVVNDVVGRDYTPADSWGYQSIQVAVNDDGVVALRWHAPAESDAVLVSDASLLPFGEIQSVLESMVFAVYDGYGAGTEIAVNGMQLGLTRIRETGNLEEGLLVPAWALYGSVKWLTEAGEPVVNDYPEGRPMLLINAVDGSIIDPNKGY